MSNLNISSSKYETKREESNHEVNIEEDQSKTPQVRESTEIIKNNTKEIEMKESITKIIEPQLNKIYFINENAKGSVENDNRRAPAFKPDVILDMRTEMVQKTQKQDQNVARSTNWPLSKPKYSTKAQQSLKHLQQDVEKQHTIEYPQGQPPRKVMYDTYYQQNYQQPAYQAETFSPGSEDHLSGRINYDPKSRNGFIGIVMLIVFVMLIMTAVFTYFVSNNLELQIMFARNAKIMLIIGMVGVMMLNYAFVCVPFVRTMPCSIIMLIAAVFFMSLVTAVITSQYRTKLVFFAAVITAGVVLVCIGLALTPFDFTAWYLYIVVISIAFSLVAIVALAAMMVMSTYIPMLHLVILLVAVLIQSVVLVMELQMILGGKAIEIGEDDWAFAAFMLYISIVDIFLKVLQILGILENLA